MAESTRKGDIGEAKILADLLAKGHKVAIPYGPDWPYDLVVEQNGTFKRIQCKYAESDGKVIEVRCRACTHVGYAKAIARKYRDTDVDYIAVYDSTTDKAYYVPATLLGAKGRAQINLRLVPPEIDTRKDYNWAKDYEDLLAE